jgi:2-oxoglutarate dehydrogenase E2 component (dihydrolipoamide succinyltransferase)
MAEEEDTVSVGQDLFKLEPGDAPAEGSSSDGGEEKKEEQPKEEQQSEKRREENKDDKGSKDSKGKGEKKDNGKEQKAESKPKQEEQPKKGGDRKPPANAPSESRPSPPSPKKEPSKESSGKDQGSSAPPPAAPGSREERRVKMSRMRLRIAERLKQSQNTAASLTTFNEVDMSALMAFRARHKDRILKEQGVKLGFMGAFAKASAMALKEIPAANASIEGDGLGDTIVYRDYVDLSVAVSTEKGLVTPVVRNVEALSILGIEREIAALGKKVRRK